MAKIHAELTAATFDGFDSEGNRCRYVRGDVVVLDEQQFEAFADQFRNVNEEREESTSEEVEGVEGPVDPEEGLLDD